MNSIISALSSVWKKLFRIFVLFTVWNQLVCKYFIFSDANQQHLQIFVDYCKLALNPFMIIMRNLSKNQPRSSANVVVFENFINGIREFLLPIFIWLSFLTKQDEFVCFNKFNQIQIRKKLDYLINSYILLRMVKGFLKRETKQAKRSDD